MTGVGSGCRSCADQGYDTTPTTLALHSLHGFYPDLIDLADRWEDVLLVDLPTLYGI